MLTIRLARQGRKKMPFFRVVLTEHTKPIQSWYKEILGWFNPLTHTHEIDVPKVKEWVAKGASISERVAKILYNDTKDATFSNFIEQRERVRTTKKQPE